MLVLEPMLSKKDSQIGYVDCSIYLLGKVVSEKTSILECPAEDIVDYEDCDVFIGSGNVGVVVSKFSVFADWCSIPLEAGQTAGRHLGWLTEAFDDNGIVKIGDTRSVTTEGWTVDMDAFKDPRV